MSVPKFKCPSCEELTIIDSCSLAMTFVPGVLVFCANCKTVITWAPKPVETTSQSDSTEE